MKVYQITVHFWFQDKNVYTAGVAIVAANNKREAARILKNSNIQTCDMSLSYKHSYNMKIEPFNLVYKGPAKVLGHTEIGQYYHNVG